MRDHTPPIRVIELIIQLGKRLLLQRVQSPPDAPVSMVKFFMELRYCTLLNFVNTLPDTPVFMMNLVLEVVYFIPDSDIEWIKEAHFLL